MIHNVISSVLPTAVRKFLKLRAAKAFGLSVYMIGDNFYKDIGWRLPNENVATVFDVGANVGQTALDIAAHFPDASIFSFEPIPETYKQLVQRTNRNPRIKAFNLGLGSQAQDVRLTKEVQSDSTSFKISHSDDGVLAKLTTVDSFCGDHRINSLDLLKIDTEGFDLEVIKGAKGMLEGALVNIVLAECSLNIGNAYHVQFSLLHGHMESLGYRLFGFYEQAMEWPTGEPYLRRANVAYISSKVTERNRSL